MKPNLIYQHSNPGVRIFGAGALKRLPKALGPSTKPLVITDQGVVKAGLLDQVAGLLEEAGLSRAVYDRTLPDPPVSQAEEAAALFKEEGCDSLLALGGGSPIDLAKAVGVLVAGGGDLREYAAGKAVKAPPPPFVAVPTTAGTGSEVTGVTVISDPERKTKMLIRSPGMIPQTSILDPLLLAKLPPRIAAETGADALSHALEGLVSAFAQPISDALALHAVRLINRNLRPMVADPANAEAAGQMLLASCLASMSWANAGLGLVHAMAHTLGAHYHVSHGKACALYLPVVMDFNAIACPDKYAAVAADMDQDVLGLPPYEAAKLAPEAVRDLFLDLDLPATYDELGISFELKEEMVDEVLSVPTHKANPRRSSREEVIALFETPAY